MERTALQELISFGFLAPEIHQVVLDHRACPFIRTEWYGEDGYFALDTGARLDLSLNGVGLRKSNLPKLRESETFAVHSIEEFTLLGQSRPAGEVTVFRGSDEGNVFGTVGILFFKEATVACDPAGPHVAVAKRAWAGPSGKEPFDRLAHVGESGLPITTDVHLSRAPDILPATLLSTGTARSYVSQRFAAGLTPNTINRHDIIEITLPTAGALSIAVESAGSTPTYAVPLGVAHIDLVLGMDVLRNFVSIFDFRNGLTLLKPYRGAV